MKKTYSLCLTLILILLSNITFSQSLYDNPIPLSNTSGKRLTIASMDLEPLNFISYKKRDSAEVTEFKVSLYLDYRQWKFDDKLLLGTYAKGNLLHIWSKTYETGDTGNFNFTRMTGTVYGGASYYLTPNQFYVTGAIGGAVDKFKIDRDFQEKEKFDTLVSSSALWGALGYGRINNREVVEYAYDFDEALIKRGIISKNLDEKTLRELSVLLYKQRDGMFKDQYEDDEYVELFREVEKTLIANGYINGNLGSAATIKLYDILRNTSNRYIVYPKYSGYQVQAQVQYQLSNITKDKPHEHYASISGIYCFNPTRKTNVVLSGFYSFPLDSMAMGTDMRSGSNYENVFQNYLPFLPDRNNLNFFKDYYGTGAFGGNRVIGLQSLAGIRGDVFHSLSSISGVQGNLLITNRFVKNADSRLHVGATARYDHNIINNLIAYVQGSWSAEKLVKPAYMFGVGFIYRVF